MSHMFQFCSALKNLDLSSFDTNKTNNVKDIFVGCQKEIYEFNKYKFIKFNENDMFREKQINNVNNALMNNCKNV